MPNYTTDLEMRSGLDGSHDFAKCCRIVRVSTLFKDELVIGLTTKIYIYCIEHLYVYILYCKMAKLVINTYCLISFSHD